MEPFTTLSSIAAPLPDADIDTDIIFPARFLTLTRKRGLARYAFHDKRFDEAGREKPDFVLHRHPWRGARILVAGANFGCGSSRENAPWALADLGIACMISTGFGAIFEANCLRNGLLPIRVGEADHATLMTHAEAGGTIEVDLVAGTLGLVGDRTIVFEIPAAARTALLEGTDEIDQILRDEAVRIADFETDQRQRVPWLYQTFT